MRRATGPFRFELTGYYTRFNGFIFRQLTGVLCDETFDACGDPDGELNQAVYSQRDAIFRGGEFQSQLDLSPLWTGMFGVENQFDVVRATFTDGTNVPRIPPVRLGGGVFWRDANWLVRVNLLHAFAHTDVEVTPTFTETPTAGYNDLVPRSATGGGSSRRRGAPPKRCSASPATTCSTTTSAIPSRTPRTRC